MSRSCWDWRVPIPPKISPKVRNSRKCREEGRKEGKKEEIESIGKVIKIKEIWQIRKKSGCSVRKEVREDRWSDNTIFNNQEVKEEEKKM